MKEGCTAYFKGLGKVTKIVEQKIVCRVYDRSSSVFAW